MWFRRLNIRNSQVVMDEDCGMQVKGNSRIIHYMQMVGNLTTNL